MLPANQNMPFRINQELHGHSTRQHHNFYILIDINIVLLNIGYDLTYLIQLIEPAFK